MKKYFLLIVALLIFQSCGNRSKINIEKIDKDRILTSAEQYLQEDPITVTSSTCDRSLGREHDFYSEGDYWWPDPENPDGPYIRKDGMTNPENFKDHRQSMRRMSIHVATLTAAFKITQDNKYASKAIEHLKAWFVNPETKMNPNMNFAQAIKGKCPGRGVGLIDGIHFVEPARCISILEKEINAEELVVMKQWFEEFLVWMTTHDYGIDERERKNNHGSCWVMQVAEFSRLTDDNVLQEYCRNRFKTVLLPNQLAADGSFPLELNRTKPYGYSLFNVDILSTVSHILSDDENDLWNYKIENGASLKTAIEFITPYIQDKSKWPYEPDVMYWDQWPVRHPALLFAGLALENREYLELWESLDPLPKTEEGLRNFPIREPIVWMNY